MLYPVIHTQGGIPGCYTQLYTQGGIPGWCIASYTHREAYPGGIYSPLHTGRHTRVVYTSMIHREAYPGGIYPGTQGGIYSTVHLPGYTGRHIPGLYLREALGSLCNGKSRSGRLSGASLTVIPVLGGSREPLFNVIPVLGGSREPLNGVIPALGGSREPLWVLFLLWEALGSLFASYSSSGRLSGASLSILSLRTVCRRDRHREAAPKPPIPPCEPRGAQCGPLCPLCASLAHRCDTFIRNINPGWDPAEKRGLSHPENNCLSARKQAGYDQETRYRECCCTRKSRIP